jgi:hypothetical protein
MLEEALMATRRGNRARRVAPLVWFLVSGGLKVHVCNDDHGPLKYIYEMREPLKIFLGGQREWIVVEASGMRERACRSFRPPHAVWL